MNSELVKRGLEKVGNPNVLINVISRRVRQLTSGAGGHSRPLVTDTAGMGAADIALTELLENKFAFELLDAPETSHEPIPKKKRKH